MRYNSSKAMMRSGARDNRGFLVGGCSDGHFTSQAPKPLAAKSPKATSTKSCSESTTRASTGGKSPKELSPEYRQLGQTKHGSKADGTDACHILSHEVLNTVLKHTPGRAFGERQQEHIAREINSDANLRQKTRDGNMYGSDGYSLVYDRNTELLGYFLARAYQLTGKACYLIIYILAKNLKISVGTVKQVDTHRDGTDIEIFLFHHFIGFYNLGYVYHEFLSL